MPNYRGRITDLVAEDDYDLTRTITDIPIGHLLAKAVFTVKLTETASTDVFQVSVTPTESDAGQIVDTGADQTGAVLLTASKTQTALLTGGTTYYYDLKVETDQGAEKTVEKGVILAHTSITGAIP